MLRRSHLCHDPGRDPAHSVGPRLSATLSYFSGCHGVSKRGVEEIAETVLGVPIALGTVANLEQEVSAALAPAHAEALAAVRRADVKYADETSWKLWGQLCWLWAAATSGVAAFVIHAQRSAQGLAAILGDSITASCIATVGMLLASPRGTPAVVLGTSETGFPKNCRVRRPERIRGSPRASDRQGIVRRLARVRGRKHLAAATEGIDRPLERRWAKRCCKARSAPMRSREVLREPDPTGTRPVDVRDG